MTKEEKLQKIYDYLGRSSYFFFDPLDEIDMIELKDKMVEKGDWKEFLNYAKLISYTSSHYIGKTFLKGEISGIFIAWLFSLELDGTDIPRFFRLFIESEVWKHD